MSSLLRIGNHRHAACACDLSKEQGQEQSPDHLCVVRHGARLGLPGRVRILTFFLLFIAEALQDCSVHPGLRAHRKMVKAFGDIQEYCPPSSICIPPRFYIENRPAVDE